MHLTVEGSTVTCPICETHVKTVVLHYNGVAFYECPECTHIFTSKLDEFLSPSQSDQLEALYDEGYLDKSVGHRPHYLTVFERYYEHSRERLRRLGKFISPPGNLLEIGCNTGYFVKAAQEVGWTSTGLDISKAAIAVARQKTKGVEYRVGRLEDIVISENSFAVVCAFHTLEHVATPMDTLSRIHDILKPGGIFYAEVPYTRRILDEQRVTDYSVLQEQEHLSHFSPESLRYALTESQFKIRQIRLVGGGYGLGVLQPRSELTGRADGLTNWLDRMRRVVFAARHIFKRMPGLYNYIRRLYWNTLKQGGGIEVFAEKV